MGFSIAIDGPAGAGKSTIARMTAKRLDLIYIDTGSMYRAVAYYFINNKISLESKESVENACSAIDIKLTYINDKQQVILNGNNITAFLREESISKMASSVAQLSSVRQMLVELQRNLAEQGRIIMDGRDIGTCVLPNADIKVYLTASSNVRAKRRFDELSQAGVSCDLDTIEKDIISRDQEDMNREISPLVQAKDAILLDTSNMSIQQVVEKLYTIYEEYIHE